MPAAGRSNGTWQGAMNGDLERQVPGLGGVMENNVMVGELRARAGGSVACPGYSHSGPGCGYTVLSPIPRLATF